MDHEISGKNQESSAAAKPVNVVVTYLKVIQYSQICDHEVLKQHRYYILYDHRTIIDTLVEDLFFIVYGKAINSSDITTLLKTQSPTILYLQRRFYLIFEMNRLFCK
jgi:hypothetical protein